MAKLLDYNGLRTIVNDYLKPESEFNSSSTHPIQNATVTQAYNDTVSTINNDKSVGYYHFNSESDLPSANSALTNWNYCVGQRAILDNTSEVFEITAISSDGDLTWTKVQNMNLGDGKVNAIAVQNRAALSSEPDGYYYSIGDNKIYKVVAGNITESNKKISVCLITNALYEANKIALRTKDILWVITGTSV